MGKPILAIPVLAKAVEYNQLENVVPIHCAVSEPGCTETLIQDSSEYLRNRVGATKGFRVPARTVDSIIGEFGLTQIHFLKVNIEGAEPLAIRGMTETIQRTRTLCICCHDFLADICGDDRLAYPRGCNRISEAKRQARGRRGNTNSLPYIPRTGLGVRRALWRVGASRL